MVGPPTIRHPAPPYFSRSNYSFRPLFSQAPTISFRPLILQIKYKVGPLTFKNTKIQTLTTNSHFLHLKNPPHDPHKIPCSFLFFVFSDPLPNIAYQPPKLNSISPLSFSPKKKNNNKIKFSDQFFLSSCFLKQITQDISLSNFRIWNL